MPRAQQPARSSRKKYFLVLDLGTTNAKGFVFDDHFKIVASSVQRLGKKFGAGGHVEQDPREMVDAAASVLSSAVAASGVQVSQLRSFGIATQRETVVAWDSATGEPIHSAIVWQDSRTAARCAQRGRLYGVLARTKTGLPVTPYFSAPKIEWLFENVPAAAKLHSYGRLRIGTVDTWILWNFTRGHAYVTDRTNASRTLLFNVKTLSWDDELCKIFSVPRSVLPKVLPSISNFGVLKKSILGVELPIAAVSGDQQASLYAAGTSKGTAKVTYGTGVFAAEVIGSKFSLNPGFFTTLAASSGSAPVYAAEAKVDVGAAQRVDRVLHSPKALKRLLATIAKGVARETRRFPIEPKKITIDGGITQAPYMAQLQADASGVRVVEQKTYEGTALGVAKMLGDSKVPGGVNALGGAK